MHISYEPHNSFLPPTGLASSEKYLKKSSGKERGKKRKKRGRKAEKSEESSGGEEEQRSVEVYIGRGEMPDGAEDSGEETGNVRGTDDPHAALDINLDEYVHS